MNRFFFLSFFLALLPIPCFTDKNIIIKTSDNQHIEYNTKKQLEILMKSQTIANMFNDMKNNKDSEVIIPLPTISKEIFEQIMLRLEYLPEIENPEEQKEKLESIEQLKNYNFTNLFHFIQAVNYLNIARLNEYLNVIYPQLIIKTNDNQEIKCTLEQKHILMQSQTIKNMLDTCNDENVVDESDENTEDKIITLDFLSEKTFNQIIQIFEIITNNKELEEKNILSKIIQELKFYETIILIDFIQAVNFLDINEFDINQNEKLSESSYEEIKKTTLLKLGLEELAQRILTQNEWLKLKDLGPLLNDLWQIHPAKKLIWQGLMLNHSGCNNVIQSINGQNLISWSRQENTIKIWNLSDSYQQGITLNYPGHDNVMQSADGQNLISWSQDIDNIVIWNFNSPDQPPTTFNHSKYPHIIQSTDGHNLISWSWQQGTIKIWDLNNLDQEPITLNHPNCENVIQSANGQNLISKSQMEGTIKIWQLGDSNKEPITLYHSRCESIIQNSYDNNLISRSRKEGTIKIWNLNSLDQEPITLNHPSCDNMTQSSNGQNLISWSRKEGTIKIWNLNNLDQKPISLNYPSYDNVIQSSDGKNFISWSYKLDTIKLWDLNNPDREPVTLNYSSYPNMLQSADGQHLISWSYKLGTIKIWDRNNLDQEPISLNHAKCYNVIESTNGQNLISWSWREGLIKIWDKSDFYKTPIILNELERDNATPSCDNVIQSCDGKNLISWSQEKGIIKIWDLKLIQLTLKEIYLLLGIYYANQGNQNINLSHNKKFLMFQNNHPDSLFYFKTLINHDTECLK